MLVKIADRARRPADDRLLGRRLLGAQGGLSPSTRATVRRARTCSSEQWPHLEPLVEAFGYRNVSVEGFEADDVIATLAERARTADPPVPVVIVTGDRDVFQLIDADGRVRVMATARGITETKMYDHEAVIDRYGIAPELIPDFYGLKGDTSDNIPGVPGIGDKTAAQLLQRFGTLEEVLANVDDISGAKRKQNLREHADDARVCKVLATMRRDVPGVDLDPSRRGRARARPLAAARDLPRVRAARPAAAAGGGARRGRRGAPRDADATVAARVRAGSPADAARLGDGEAPLARRACGRPRWPRASCSPVSGVGASASPAAGRWSRARSADPAELVAALGRAPGHRPRREGAGHRSRAARARHAARRLPARPRPPRLPVRRALRGARPGDRARGRPGGRRGARTGARAAAARGARRARPGGSCSTSIELPLVRVLRDMEIAGVRLEHRAARRRSARACAEEIDGLERRDLGPRRRGVRRSGRRSSSARSCSSKLGLSKKRRGKTGFSTDARVLQSIRAEHEIVPLIERWRELNQLTKTYLDVLPALVDEESAHPHDVRAGGRLDRAGCRRTNPNLQNVPIRTPLGREIRGCFEAAPGHVLLSADYSQIELRVLAHVADEPVLKEIFIRGEDVHTATAREVFQVAEEDIDPGHALEGEDDQLRDRLRAVRLRARRPAEHPARGGEGVHRRLPRALPACRGVHGARRSSGGRSRAT